jgi:hypothetical protein
MGWVGRKRLAEGFVTNNSEKPMTIKTLSAIAILSTALSSPVLAQTASVNGPTYDGPTYHLRHFRGTYNQVPLNGPSYAGGSTVWGRIGEDLQFNRSFPGGRDPSFNPAGN